MRGAVSLLLTIKVRTQTQKKVVRFDPTAETIRDSKFILKMLFFICCHHNHTDCDFPRVRAGGEPQWWNELYMARIFVCCACVTRGYTTDCGGPSRNSDNSDLVANQIRVL